MRKLNLAKYEFDSKEQFDSKLESLYEVDEQGNKTPKISFEAMRIGSIILEAEEKDLQGEVIKEAVISNKYHVDMAWYNLDDHPYGWKSYYVNIDGNGVSKVAGIEYNDYKF